MIEGDITQKRRRKSKNVQLKQIFDDWKFQHKWDTWLYGCLFRVYLVWWTEVELLDVKSNQNFVFILLEWRLTISSFSSMNTRHNCKTSKLGKKFVNVCSYVARRIKKWCFACLGTNYVIWGLGCLETVQCGQNWRKQYKHIRTINRHKKWKMHWGREITNVYSRTP